MSRKRARQGQIEFTGLRFFLQKMEGRVSRKELVELIRRFFTSRELHNAAVRVEFRMTRRPTGIIDGRVSSIAGCMRPGQHRVEIYLGAVNSDMTPAEVMQTIAHELDHEVWELEGRRFDDSQPYWFQSHEIRARESGAKWHRRTEVWI